MTHDQRGFTHLRVPFGSSSAPPIIGRTYEEENGMIEAGSVSVQTNHAFIGLAQADVDIERICRESSEKAQPPEVFLLTSESVGSALLGISLAFLERGQLLPCPGLPLVGAAFDPDWGFARAEIKLHRDGSAEFCLPRDRPDTFTEGDMFGYRLCPIDNHEIPDVMSQLAYIRAELAKPRQQPATGAGIKVTVTGL